MSSHLPSVFSEYTINYRSSIRESIAKINSNGGHTLFVLDNSNVVIGSLTDGDLRRSLLTGSTLDDHCIDAAFSEFHRFSTITEANFYSEINSIHTAVPFLHHDGTLSSIIYKDHALLSTSIPVFILAGGRGKRLRPLTSETPKPLLPN